MTIPSMCLHPRVTDLSLPYAVTLCARMFLDEVTVCNHIYPFNERSRTLLVESGQFRDHRSPVAIRRREGTHRVVFGWTQGKLDPFSAVHYY